MVKTGALGSFKSFARPFSNFLYVSHVIFFL